MNDYTPPPGYTPSDDEVKDDFLNMGVMRDEENAETLDRWYRWLAEHDRQVKAEALEPIRALLEEDWLVPCGDHPEGHQHDAGGWPSEALDLIAAIVREGRA